VTLGRRVDLALDQRPGHSPACMPLRHDRADPGKGRRRGLRRRSLPQATDSRGSRLLITSAPAAASGPPAGRRLCREVVHGEMRRGGPATQAEDALEVGRDDQARQRRGPADSPGHAIAERRALRPRDACAPWRAGR
jgi:hypothetical protein